MSFHAGNPETSKRLQRVLSSLRNAGRIGVTSRTLAREANVVSPATCVSELRKAGYVIDCTLLTTWGDGTKVYLYRLLSHQGVPWKWDNP